MGGKYFYQYRSDDVVKKPEIIYANESTWNSIISDTLWKISSLLGATQTLLADVEEDNDEYSSSTTGYPDVSAGLYTFAVEEYGKFLYLKSIRPIDKKYPINYANEFTNHAKKFELALSDLPEECKLIHLGNKEHGAHLEPDYYDVVANFETRLRIFYSDFDSRFANKVIKNVPPVSVTLLKIAVQKLLEMSNSQHIEHMKKNKNLINKNES